MKFPSIIKIVLLVFIGCVNAIAQHEVTVEDIGANGDAVIEIVVDSLDNISPRKMILGLNQSSEGFLRMRTDHDLSFWTFNKKRMTVKNTGEVGIGTSAPLEKLYIKNGSLGIETETFGLFGDDELSSINFFTESTYKAGITYGDTQADGKFMSFNNTGSSSFFWKSNNKTRMLINNDGSVRITELEGSDTRPIYATSNGTLTTEATSLYSALMPSHFTADNSDEDTKLISDGFKVSCQFAFGFSSGLIYANPSIPFSKYLIEDITVYFYNDTNSNLAISIVSPNNFNVADNISTTSNNTQQITIPVNQEFDAANANDRWRIAFGINNLNQLIYKVIIKYKPLN